MKSKPAILLVDHGSRRPEANAQLEALGEQVQARVGERFVTIAHMELAEPSIADGIAACVDAGATEIVVVDCHGAGKGWSFNSM